MYCIHCGSPVSDDDVFCAECGKRIERVQENAEPQNADSDGVWSPYDSTDQFPKDAYDASTDAAAFPKDPPAWNDRDVFSAAQADSYPAPSPAFPQAQGEKKSNGKAIATIVIAVGLGLGLGGGSFLALTRPWERKKAPDPATVTAATEQSTSQNSTDSVVNMVDSSDMQTTQTAEPDTQANFDFDITEPTTESSAGFQSSVLPGNIERADSYFDYRPRIVQADASVTLRSGPGKSYDKVYSVAKKSLVYEVAISADREWSLIYYRYYNQYGWMANRYLTEMRNVQVNEQSLNSGSVEVNGRTYRVGNVSAHSYKVREHAGLILRDADSKSGEWVLRMEYGDSVKEICRSLNNPEWGYIEYNDGVRTYRGFAHSDYYG